MICDGDRKKGGQPKTKLAPEDSKGLGGLTVRHNGFGGPPGCTESPRAKSSGRLLPGFLQENPTECSLLLSQQKERKLKWKKLRWPESQGCPHCRHSRRHKNREQGALMDIIGIFEKSQAWDGLPPALGIGSLSEQEVSFGRRFTNK